MSDPTPPCPSRQGRLVCLFNAGHEIPCSFYDPTTAAPAPAADWTPATPPRRASPAEPEQWDRIDLEHWPPIEPDPDDSIAAFVDVAREALVELRRNIDAFHAVADALRTLATTLGQRTEQEVQERKLLHSDVAGHYGGHEYRVPRGQS